MPGRLVELIKRDSTPWHSVLAGVWLDGTRECASNLDGRLPEKRQSEAGGAELDLTGS
jgi:hypothetical protein